MTAAPENEPDRAEPDRVDAHEFDDPEAHTPPSPVYADIRFSLANERTFLAYVRTSIGLVAAGLLVFHLTAVSWADALLGIALVASGALAVLGGWVRYRQAGRAIEVGASLSPGIVVPALTLAVLVCVAIAVFSVIA